ncbi:sugar porter family MFS transporter [Sporobolomyces koalae]|uniref:sugar porter family MFS transporter n=1 Tax=Sporobolomyces koalae TaxID=500713 RepID=UPI0031754EE4
MSGRAVVLRSVLVASLCAFLFGFDTGTIGSITTMKSFVEYFGQIDEVVRGLVVAIILLPSAISGIFAGAVADKISRKYTIALGSGIFALGSGLATASPPRLGVLFAARIIAGFGEGLFLGTLTVYIAEISPPHIRGKMMLVCQLFISSAIALGFFCCYGSVKIASSLAWRLPFAISTLVAISVVLSSPFLPHSPRWLLLAGRRDEAEKVLDLLVGDSNPQERKELMSAGPPAVVSRRAAFLRIWKADVRRRTLLGIFLNVFQQLSGIDFVLFFAPLLFTQAGLDPSTASFIASGVTGIVLVVVTVIGSTYIDKIGRRPLFLIGGSVVAASQLILGIMYASGANKGGGRWFIIILIELLAASFSASWALVVRLYSSEIQPSRTRAAAASFSQASNQATNFVVAMTGPTFLTTVSGPYFTYGFLSLFAVVVALFTMPETIGSSLEDIDSKFESSKSATVVQLPEVLRRVVGRHNDSELRRRRSSRKESQTLPGETRAEFRAHMEHEMQRLGEIDEQAVVA